MPLYEYTCSACTHDFELLVRSGEQAACPTCGTDKLTKKFSVPAAKVNGSSKGFELPMASSGPGCGAPSCCMGKCQS